MPANAAAHVRIARPSRDLRAAERFRVSGLGLGILYRHEADGTPGLHSLLMVGWPGAAWHLELVHGPAAPIDPHPTPRTCWSSTSANRCRTPSWSGSNCTAASGCPRTIRTGTPGA